MAGSAHVSEVTELSLILFQNKIDLQDNWAEAIFKYLKNFNGNGVGPMPDYDFSVPIPGAPFISFTLSNTEIVVNGTPFSGCNSEERAILWRWHRNFIKGAIENYQQSYGI